MLNCQMQITFTLRKTKFKGEGPWSGRSLKGTTWIIPLVNGWNKWSKINEMFVQQIQEEY